MRVPLQWSGWSQYAYITQCLECVVCLNRLLQADGSLKCVLGNVHSQVTDGIAHQGLILLRCQAIKAVACMRHGSGASGVVTAGKVICFSSHQYA